MVLGNLVNSLYNNKIKTYIMYYKLIPINKIIIAKYKKLIIKTFLSFITINDNY